MSQHPDTKLCMIIGDPVAHSLSPAIHNAAYSELGIDGQYHYEARRVTREELAAFMQEVRDSGIRGISCTAPHKVTVMDYLDEVDPVAAKIGAVNTVVNEDGTLKGYNTDWLGVIEPLEKLASLKDSEVALLGAGGAAKAIAYGLGEREAEFTVYNRTPGKAGELAREFGGQSASLDDAGALEAIKSMKIIINATSAGMHPNEAETPLPQEFITGNHIVFDTIYSPYETRFLREAALRGATVIHGTEMLLRQGMVQFKLYTGYDAPEMVMRNALAGALNLPGENP